MCFVVGALRRAVLIHARVVLSADDFSGRKSHRFFFLFFLFLFLFFFPVVFSLWKKRRFSFRSEDGEYVSSLLEQLLLPFFHFQRLLISLFHSIHLSLFLSLVTRVSLSLRLSLSIFLSSSVLSFFLLSVYSGTQLLYIMPLSFIRERNTQCNRVTSNSR